MTQHATEAVHHAGEAAQHAGHGVKAALGRKLGPMPVGGWILAMVGGVAVALYFRNRSAGDAGDLADIPDNGETPGDFQVNDGAGFDQADPGGTNPGVGGSPAGSSGGSSTPTTDQAGNPTTPGTPAHRHHTHVRKAKQATTNTEWQTQAVQAMVQMGFGEHAVNETLTLYLAGKRLNAAQELRLSATLARVGPPPQPPKHVRTPGTGHHATPHVVITKPTVNGGIPAHHPTRS